MEGADLARWWPPSSLLPAWACEKPSGHMTCVESHTHRPILAIDIVVLSPPAGGRLHIIQTSSSHVLRPGWSRVRHKSPRPSHLLHIPFQLTIRPATRPCSSVSLTSYPVSSPPFSSASALPTTPTASTGAGSNGENDDAPVRHWVVVQDGVKCLGDKAVQEY